MTKQEYDRSTIPYQCTKCGWETVGRQNLCRCGKCMKCHSEVKEKE